MEGEERDRSVTDKIYKVDNQTEKEHAIRKEMGRRKIAIETVKRAMTFDVKMSKVGENTWEKTCWE